MWQCGTALFGLTITVAFRAEDIHDLFFARYSLRYNYPCSLCYIGKMLEFYVGGDDTIEKVYYIGLQIKPKLKGSLLKSRSSATEGTYPPVFSKINFLIHPNSRRKSWGGEWEISSKIELFGTASHCFYHAFVASFGLLRCTKIVRYERYQMLYSQVEDWVKNRGFLIDEFYFRETVMQEFFLYNS